MNNKNNSNTDNNSDIYIDNITYLNSNKFDEKNIIIKKMGTYNYITNIDNYKYIGYDIKYTYHNKFIDNLNIMFNNVRLKQAKYYKNYYGNHILPYDNKCENGIFLEKIINIIKDKFIRVIENDFGNILDNENLKYFKNLQSKIHITNNEKLCKIIKLGSKTENNINIEIKTIEEFSDILSNKFYNKLNSDRFYYTHPIIGFKGCIYRKGMDKWNISFKPYVIMTEMQYSNSKCINLINREDQLIYTDNTLIL